LPSEADQDCADGRRGENLVLQNQRGRQKKQRDDDRVLDDRRKTVGKVIDSPGIDRERDGGADDAEGQKQRLDEPELLIQLRRQVELRSDSRQECIRGERHGGKAQPAAHVAIGDCAAKHERRSQKRQPDDHRAGIVPKNGPPGAVVECWDEKAPYRGAAEPDALEVLVKPLRLFVTVKLPSSVMVALIAAIGTV
jgi:hypothetical protein